MFCGRQDFGDISDGKKQNQNLIFLIKNMYYLLLFFYLFLSPSNSEKLSTISGCFYCDGPGVAAQFFSSSGLV